jgi:hypothetical protein
VVGLVGAVVVGVEGSVLAVVVPPEADDAIFVIRVFCPESPIRLAATMPVVTMTSAVAPPLMMTTGCRRKGRKIRCLPR